MTSRSIETGSVPAFLFLLLGLLLGCETMKGASIEGETPPHDPVEDRADSRDRNSLRAELTAAEERLALARQSLEHHEALSREQVHIAEMSLEHTEKKWRQFEEIEAPLQRAEARLSLREASDGLLESQEELAQLEQMYAQDDLADATREIVLQRGKRRLDRAGEEVSIQERRLQQLEEHSLPLEALELRGILEEKRSALESARRDALEGRLEKKIEILEAESEVVRLRAKLDEAGGLPDRSEGTEQAE